MCSRVLLQLANCRFAAAHTSICSIICHRIIRINHREGAAGERRFFFQMMRITSCLWCARIRYKTMESSGVACAIRYPISGYFFISSRSASVSAPGFCRMLGSMLAFPMSYRRAGKESSPISFDESISVRPMGGQHCSILFECAAGSSHWHRHGRVGCFLTNYFAVSKLVRNIKITN